MKKKTLFKVYGEKLQDLFRFNDGSAVETALDWAMRRGELKQILQSECYGFLPPAPGSRPEIRLIQPPVPYHCVNNAFLSQFLTFPFHGSDFSIELDVYMPAANEQASFPVIICGDGCWRRFTRDFVAAVTSRGYAAVIFNRCEVVPDCPYQEPGAGPRIASPLRGSVLERRHGDLIFGAIAGWAWGFSRVLDAVKLIPGLNAEQAVACGHSRGGKASLLAGAFDERFSVVSANGSGSGGGGCWMFQAEGTEPLDHITEAFPTWFTESFRKYSDQVPALPFDQHFLKALCAPRPLFTTDGFDDLWANPAGACITHLEARKVYEFLRYPASYAAMHFREGGHRHTVDDWRRLLDYCDFVFYRKTPEWDPLGIPYDLPQL